ncbi:MAG: hypothetical protein LVO36_00485 [Nitrosopumilus sp. (ex Thoosa mismalolli)]|nr:hypothetical protein [Nitrosopumilus sp. (ex Thoosa mismalolli)]
MSKDSKSPAELLKEEQDLLSSEIKEKDEKRKQAMNPDQDPDNEYVK